MNARDAGLAPGAAVDDDMQAPNARIAAIDWASVHADLDTQGAAVIPGLSAPIFRATRRTVAPILMVALVPAVAMVAAVAPRPSVARAISISSTSPVRR